VKRHVVAGLFISLINAGSLLLTFPAQATGRCPIQGRRPRTFEVFIGGGAIDICAFRYAFLNYNLAGVWLKLILIPAGMRSM